MPKYFLEERQDGGCDYTIGCGIRVRELAATSKDEAIDEACGKDKYGEYVICAEGNYAVSSARIFEVSDVIPLNVAGLAELRQRQRDQETASANEANERAEYERLQRKFASQGA